jgi:uncharacterized membrane protein YgcG
MRKLLFAFILVLIPVFALAEVSSIENGYSENIKSYDVDAKLGDGGIIDVVETIVYDFGNNEKHGIFRYIPTVYEGREGSPRQTLKLHSVTNENNISQPHERSSEKGSAVIKIGDPNKLITGIYTYKIQYTITRVISTDSDGDRFRWDAIGTGWQVPIKQAMVRLTLNDKHTNNIQTTNCFSGEQGVATNCNFIKDGKSLVVAENNLPAHTGLTIDILLDSGTFPAPNRLEQVLWMTHWYYWLSPLFFIIFFVLWYERGRDPNGRGTIVPMYDPPMGLTPFESSIIMDEILSRKSLPATIISLAIKGYIKIHRKEIKVLFQNKAEYELELIKPLPETATTIEKKIIELFFTGRNIVNLKDLDDTFAKLNASLHREAYKQVTEKGFFVVNPTISRIIYFALSVAGLVFGILAAIYFLISPLEYVWFLLPGVISFLFAFIMPVRTKQGVLVREDLLGLKMYIDTAEIDRIKFHNAPEKSPEKFEELLPYAIVFGLEKKWAEEFRDIYRTPPSWYDGNMATFSVVGLTHDIGNFSDAAISAVVSSTSSGGSGGFSGGGFGGGGGGSW